LMAGQNHAVPPIPDADERPNPLDPAIRQMHEALDGQHSTADPTKLHREDYIHIVEGVVDYFHHFQAPDGRIIDPFVHREIQYSTPTYALAAAVLIESGKRPDLLDSASRALDCAMYELASHSAADKVGDFFIVPVMLAYRYLDKRVSPAVRSRWNGYLRTIDPDLAYSDRIGIGQPDVMNWNSSALAGEFLRYKAGFTDLSFVSRYLDAQLPRFTPEGLYRDPGTPLVYDAAARFNFLLLLEEGYAGPHSKALNTLLARGAWASLLMQSSAGDFPAGGRSTEHSWNDALQCAAFEIWARRSAQRGDATAAQAFKRGAHLAARAITRWIRPSGELWIVKNHFDPAVRHGFESYSFHSQYNLLTAAYLAMAWSFADDNIAEGVSPADTGGFLVDLPEFRKVFANIQGHYLEIETGADPHYNSTGLLRIHRPDMVDQIGPSDNPPIEGNSAQTGLSWQTGAVRESLAQIPAERITASTSLESLSAKEMRFSVLYELSGAAIKRLTETYTLTPNDVTVTVKLDGPIDAWTIAFPAFLSDGERKGQSDLRTDALTVHSALSGQQFQIIEPAVVLTKTDKTVTMRTGDYQIVEATGNGNVVTYRIGRPTP
jgi:hypothetical protein